MQLKEHKLFKGGRGWLSDDEKRIPLRVEADVLGDVFAELQSMRLEQIPFLPPMLKAEFFLKPVDFVEQLEDLIPQIHIAGRTEVLIRRTTRIASSSKYQPLIAGSRTGDIN
jgi:hypothetical protein